jgi:hypothetical protein
MRITTIAHTWIHAFCNLMQTLLFCDKNQILVSISMQRPWDHAARSGARKVCFYNNGFMYVIAFFPVVLKAHFCQYLISRINV